MHAVTYGHTLRCYMKKKPYGPLENAHSVQCQPENINLGNVWWYDIEMKKAMNSYCLQEERIHSMLCWELLSLDSFSVNKFSLKASSPIVMFDEFFYAWDCLQEYITNQTQRRKENKKGFCLREGFGVNIISFCKM